MKNIILFLDILFLGLVTPTVSKSQDFRYIDSCITRNLFDIDTILADNDKLYYIYGNGESCVLWVVEDKSHNPRKILTAEDMNVLYLQIDSLYMVIERTDTIFILFIKAIVLSGLQLIRYR